MLHHQPRVQSFRPVHSSSLSFLSLKLLHSFPYHPMHLKRKPPPISIPAAKELEQVYYKRQKTEDYKDWIQPPVFWDNLSSIPLTRRALEEHDRRCGEAPNTIQHRKRKRLPKKWLLQVPTRIARHGGLDLTDLRGVSSLMAVAPC